MLAEDQHHIITEAEGICKECGALCCKPLLMQRKPFGLTLKLGDMAHLRKLGYVALLFHVVYPEEGTTDHVIMPHVFGYCPLLDHTRKKCTIYTDRPSVCRHFPYELTPDVLQAYQNLYIQQLGTSPPKMGGVYDVNKCTLLQYHQENYPTFFQSRQTQIIDDKRLQIESIHPLSVQDQATSKEFHKLFYPFMIPEITKDDPSGETWKLELQKYPSLIHPLYSGKWGSFLLSGYNSNIKRLTRQIIDLLLKYQTYFGLEKIVVSINVLDNTSKGDQRKNHLKLAPIFRIRGIFGKNVRKYSKKQLLRLIETKFINYHADGTILVGIIFKDDLDRPVSYWYDCWKELQVCLKTQHDDNERSIGGRRTLRGKSPFRPKRRRL